MDKISLNKIDELTLSMIPKKKSNTKHLLKLEKEIKTLKISNK